MKDFFDRFRQYLRESAERKLMIGRMTVSRLTIFGIAAGILLGAIFALIYLLYGKRDTALTYERTEVDAGFQYHCQNGLLSYRAGDYLFTYDGEKDALTYYRLNSAVQGIRDQNVGERFDVMEDIARRVPLSGIRRPAWDLKLLADLGLQAGADENVWQRVWSDEEKVSFASTPLFMISARKDPL